MSPAIEAPLDRYRGVVLSDWIDYNGHMNLAYYMVAFDHATDLFFDHVGLDRRYRAEQGGSTFAAEVHICYLRELHEGDGLRITTELLAFDEKRLRFFHRMYHAADGYQAATIECLSLHVDMARRKVAPMPDRLLVRLAAFIEAQGPRDLPDEAGRAILKPPLPGRAGSRDGGQETGRRNGK